MERLRFTFLCLALIPGQQVSGTRYISLFALVQADQDSGSQLFSRPRGHNLLDGGAPFYDVYTCSDGHWMSVGCIEPRFFKTFIDRFIKGLGPDTDTPLEWRPTPETRMNREEWPRLRKFLVDGFRSNTRDHWAKIFQSKRPIMDTPNSRSS
jgi:alpha-methylacyl-CoA racemase